MSTVAGPTRREERPARFHHPVNDIAGLILLLVLGAAIGFELGRHPVSPMYVAAGCFGLIAMLALAILRYDWAVALGVLLMPVVRAEPAPVDAVLAIVMAVNSVIAFYYYAGVLRRMWMDEPYLGDVSPVRVPPSLFVALALTTVATMAFGVAPGIVTHFTDVPVAAFANGP